jgi:hypothetical protein
MLPDDEFEREHPSYGLIRISRVTGGPGAARLFGSPLANHYGTIRLSIGSAKWTHGLHHDRYYGSMHGEHVEIEMSAAQFADMITSLNVGSGTPCTIRYLAGVQIPNPPDYATEAEHIRDSFEGSLDKYKAKARECRKRIEDLTSKLSSKAKDEIRRPTRIQRPVRDQAVPGGHDEDRDGGKGRGRGVRLERDPIGRARRDR